MCLNLQQDPLNPRGNFSQFKVSSRPSRQERPCNLAESPCSWASRPLHLFWVAECPCLPTLPLPHQDFSYARCCGWPRQHSARGLLVSPPAHPSFSLDKQQPTQSIPFVSMESTTLPCPPPQPAAASLDLTMSSWMGFPSTRHRIITFHCKFWTPPGASDTARPMPWAEWQHVAPGTVCRAPRRGVGPQPPLGRGNQMALSHPLPSPTPQCAGQFLVSSLLSTCRTDSGTTSCLRVGSWHSWHVISGLGVGQYTRILCRLQL